MSRLSHTSGFKSARKRRPLRVLVTGGPTKAYLDRVRYLSNYSTGSVAYEICKTFHNRRAKVAAVIGPTALDFSSLKLAIFRPVETFDEMRKEVHRVCKVFRPDIVVFSAAVLDFVPVKIRSGKVSSKQKTWTIQLKPTPKIIDEIGKRFPHIRRVGFKLQWKEKHPAQFGKKILETKKLDALVLNDLSQVEGQFHPAFLFERGKAPVRVNSKKAIANWIADAAQQFHLV